MTVTKARTAAPLAGIALILLGLTACGSTWDGMKQDTSENVDAMGKSLEDAGEAIQSDDDDTETKTE